MNKDYKKRILFKKSEARRDALGRADVCLYGSKAWLESAEAMSRYANDSESRDEKNKFLRNEKLYRKKAESYFNAAKRYERIGGGKSASKVRGLEKTASALVAVLGIVVGLFLLVPKINGNIVGVVSSSQNGWGIVILLAGIVGAYLFFRKR